MLYSLCLLLSSIQINIYERRLASLNITETENVYFINKTLIEKIGWAHVDNRFESMSIKYNSSADLGEDMG